MTVAAHRISAVLAALVLGTVTGCSGTSSPEPLYYVSIGDSYATGDSPHGRSPDGFAYRTEAALRRDGDWELVNFGCAGATATQLAEEPGCDPGALAEDAPSYGSQSQIEAAARFVAEHRDRIGLVTIVAGGNDVAGCLAAPSRDAALSCAQDATASAASALAEMLGTLGAVLDPAVPVLGLSYLNVFLADPQPWRAEVAASVFDRLLQPALHQTYTDGGARFLASVSELADSVDQVCALSYYCTDGDPHPNREGHQRIADVVLAAARP